MKVASGGIMLSLTEHKAAVRALAWRSDSRLLASGGEDGVLALAFGPEGELLSAGRDRQVRLWRADGRAAKSFPTESALPLQASITHDGRTLFAGDDAGTVRHWAPLP